MYITQIASNKVVGNKIFESLELLDFLKFDF